MVGGIKRDKKMIKSHWTVRDMVHYYKYRFLLSNIKRGERSKSPHGCYRNRGNLRRYIKNLDRYLTNAIINKGSV